MTTAVSATSRTKAAPRAAAPGLARALLLLVTLLAAIAGFLATTPDQVADAVSQAGADLTRLLRAMALLKAVIAAGAAGAIVWRLGAAATLPWLAAYAAACTAMAAGPALIWGMAHVGLGAAMLHGGLLAAVVLLWRDPVLAARLAAIVASRRAALREAGR